MAENFSKSGHSGWQSSVVCWNNGNPKAQSIFDSFDYSKDRYNLWGDQEWIEKLLKKNVTVIPHPLVGSYKYHCRTPQRPLQGASVITFHGLPNPPDCPEDWIKDAWR